MKKKLKSGIFVVSDVILLGISFFMAYLIRFDFVFDAIPSSFKQTMGALLVISIISKILVFIPFKLYRSHSTCRSLHRTPAHDRKPLQPSAPWSFPQYSRLPFQQISAVP